MEFLAVFKIFIVILACFIGLLIGVLLIRHRQFIAYFKDAFTFVREDYEAEQENTYDSIFRDLENTLRYGYNTLFKSKSQVNFGPSGSNEINQIIVLIGKIIIAMSILGMILAILEAIWMIT